MAIVHLRASCFEVHIDLMVSNRHVDQDMLQSRNLSQWIYYMSHITPTRRGGSRPSWRTLGKFNLLAIL